MLPAPYPPVYAYSANALPPSPLPHPSTAASLEKEQGRSRELSSGVQDLQSQLEELQSAATAMRSQMSEMGEGYSKRLAGLTAELDGVKAAKHAGEIRLNQATTDLAETRQQVCAWALGVSGWRPGLELVGPPYTAANGGVGEGGGASGGLCHWVGGGGGSP